MDDTGLDTTRPVKLTLVSRLAEDVRRRILDGVMSPGEKINLDAIRRDFGTSVSSVREAIGRLVIDGLVTFEDHRGYRVAPISLAHLKEITRLRAELEGMALREAVAKGGVEWEINVMSAVYRLNRVTREAGNQASIKAWEAVHRTFHLALIQHCEMPQLLQFCDVLHNQNDRYRRLFLQRSAGDRDVAAEHAAIAEAAVAHDADRASGLLVMHIERTGTNLLKRLQAQFADPYNPADDAG